MIDKTKGGPAFPTTNANYNNELELGEGMTLRDYFAAKALQSFMLWALDQETFDGYETAEACCRAYARSSYAIADAMLEARK